MEYLIALLIGGAIFLIALSIWGIKSSTPSIYGRISIEETARVKKLKQENLLGRIFALSNWMIQKLKIEESLSRSLYAAHAKFSPQEFFTIKLGFLVGLPIFAFFAIGNKPHIVLIALAAGYLLPNIWLKRKTNNYKQTISRLLPESVDLLGLCIEAGLDFTSAVDWIVRKTKHTPVVEELSFVLEEIKWGKSRGQALKDMAKRLDLPEINSFTQILVQAERMGTPVVEVFSILSEDTRMQRYRRGERLALQAPIKMLIPLIFCVLPVIAIVIAGPILIQFSQGSFLKGM